MSRYTRLSSGGIYCLLLLLYTLKGAAQISSDPYLVEHLGIEDGLPSRQIRDIAQDGFGLIWMASADHGLIRYDGHNFSCYTASPTSKIRLGSNRVLALVIDHSGRIWAGHESGIDIIEPFSMSVRNNIPLIPGKPGVSGEVRSLYLDSDGAVWATVRDLGLVRFEQGDPERPTVVDNLPNGYYINRSPDGNLWALGGQCAFRWENGAFRLIQGMPRFPYILPFENEKGLLVGLLGVALHQNTTQCFKLDESGNLAPGLPVDAITWASVSGFTSDFPKKAAPAHEFPGLYDTNFRVFNDRNGLIWVATRDFGVFKMRKRIIHFTVCPDLDEISLRGMAEMPDGAVYVASYDGLFRYDPRHNKATLVSKDFDLTYHIIQTGPDTLTCLTDGAGIFHYFPSTNRYKRLEGIEHITSERSFYTALPLENGRFLMGNREIFTIGAPDWLPQRVATLPDIHNRITTMSLEKAGDGRIWIGTNAGVFVLNPSGSVELPKIRKDYRLGETAQINDIYIDRNGVFWFATKQYGLIRLEPSTGYIQVFDAAHGLNSDETYAILPNDNADQIAVSTAGGLSCLSISGQGEIFSFTYDDGTASSEFNTGSALRSRSGELFFGSIGGLTRFRLPSGNTLTSSPDCQMFISSVGIEYPGSSQTLQINYPGKDTLVWLPSMCDALEFYFGCTNYFRPDRHKFFVRLEGLDKNWVPIGNEFQMRYYGLPPGKYTFSVKCSLPHSHEENPFTFSFIVKAPFYRQPWFPILIGAGVILLLWLLFRLRINQIQHEQNFRRQIAADLHDDLGGSMGAISNIIHVIKRRKKEGKPIDKEIDHLQNLSKSAHSAMSDIIWAIDRKKNSNIDLSNRLHDYADKWLKMAGIKVRFTTDVSTIRQPFSFHTKHQILLAYKEILSNILKHTHSELVDIHLVINMKHQLTLHVKNIFSERNMDAHSSGRGLESIRHRIVRIGGEVVIEEYPSEFVVIIRLGFQ